MALVDHSLPFNDGFGLRQVDVTLYTSPTGTQSKYAWHGIVPTRSGTLRQIRVYIASPAGSPTLEWRLYDTVPANGNPNNLTPVASGTITNIAAAGWFELIANANMPVTRGTPFMLWFGCTAGTSLVLKSVPHFSYPRVAGYVFGSWWGSQDGTTWTAASATGTYYFNPLQMTFTVEANNETYYYGYPWINTPVPTLDITNTNHIAGQSYQLPTPVQLDGFTLHIYPAGTTARLRGELRAINTTTWEPDMSAGGLIDYVEFERSYRTKSGIDDTALPFLFPNSHLVQNFALLVKATRYDGTSISSRCTSPFDATICAQYAPHTRAVYSTNGGTSWTVYTDRRAIISLLNAQMSGFGGGGGGGLLPIHPHLIIG